MSRSKYRRQGGEKFIKLDRHVYRSQAWQALKPNDIVLYLALLMRYEGFNNGRIALSYSDAATDANITNRRTLAASFRNLVTLGFVRVATPSAYSRKDRTATEYLLTEYRDDRTGTPPTKDYMKWRPQEKTTSGKNAHDKWQIATCGTKKRPNPPLQVAIRHL